MSIRDGNGNIIKASTFTKENIEKLLKEPEKILFSHKEIVDLFQKHSDDLKSNKEVTDFLKTKFKDESNIEVKNLL
jgi:hypothetical protein